MVTITTRAGKGSALTHAEVDANFNNLNTDKVEKSATLTANYLLKGNGTNAVTLSGIFEDGSGNVGVGTTTIGVKFDINGAARVTSGGDGGYFVFKYTTASADSRSWTFYNDHSAYGDFHLLQSATQSGGPTVSRMHFAPGGNVGIGKTLSDYKLFVNGTFGIAPGASVTPTTNGDVVFELTNNTTLTIKAKGSDGTVRSATITLA